MGQVPSISRAILVVLLCLLTTPVFAWSHGLAVNTCPQGTSFADGCAAAPSGTPQFAAFLKTGTIINAGLAGVGTGYTNGTAYAWSFTCSTTNATGTVDVVGGVLSNVQITNHGVGCTAGENNITTPVGAGAGTGGQIQGYSPAVRPPWNVAGVDFAVGPAITPTLDPATISVSGVSVNTTTCTISITGNNVTLSGYDYTKTTCNSGVGGWHIVVSGSASTISNFIAQSPPSSLTALGFIEITAGSNHVISNCTIDGNIANQTVASDGWLIAAISPAGPFTIEYCYLKNAFGDNVATEGGNSPSLTLKYNILTNSKFSAAHGEYVNAPTGTSNSVYDFNLTIQNYADSTGFPGQLSSVWENSATDSSNSVSGLEQSFNTSFLFGTAGHQGSIANQGATSVWSDLHTIPSGTSTNTSPKVQSNYVAVSGIIGTVPGAGFLTCDASVITPTVSGNINMNSNATIVGNAPCN